MLDGWMLSGSKGHVVANAVPWYLLTVGITVAGVMSLVGAVVLFYLCSSNIGSDGRAGSSVAWLPKYETAAVGV